MSELKRDQIWLVNFDPSFGHEYKKVRPALVIQNDGYLASSSLITVIPISSQTTKQTELDILLRTDAQNRLKQDSLLKTKQVSSFDKGRFIKLIGALDEKTMKSVSKNIKKLLL